MTNLKPTAKDAANFWANIKAAAKKNGRDEAEDAKYAEAEAELCERLAAILDRVGA